MSDTIRVKVTVDTDELREWAGKHADSGHHGVAHVLYRAAEDGESLTEQALREAKAGETDAAVARALECVREWTDMIGRISVSAHEHSAFTSELADAIQGIER